MSEHTGIGTYIQNVLREISKVPEVKLKLICRSKNSLELFGQPEIHTCGTEIYTIREQFDLMRFFPKKSEDGWFWSPHINIPLFYQGPKLVVTVHDLLFFEKDYFPQSTLKNIYRDLFFSVLTKKAKLIFTPSKFTRDELIKRFPITSDKTHVTHLGVSGSWRKQLDPVKNKSIVFIGNHKRNKNLRLLINAFNQVKHRIPHKLYIIGASKGLRTTEDIHNFNIDANRVVVEERLPQNILLKKVQEADLIVCPSLYEGFGLVPLEAYAAGAKVLCSDIPVHKEIMGDCAIFFKSDNLDSCADGIIKALESKIGSNQEEVIKRFNWQASAKQSLDKLFSMS